MRDITLTYSQGWGVGGSSEALATDELETKKEKLVVILS